MAAGYERIFRILAQGARGIRELEDSRLVG
jgi:hypothetical protein